MARQRTLNPNFFVDEKVVQVSAFARLMFQGLWCLADREGRLERKPLRLKMQLFPADNVDGEALLCELEGVGLVLRYEVDGVSYLAIPGFVKHQHVHPKEVPSKIPPPPGPGSGGKHGPKARASASSKSDQVGKTGHDRGPNRAGSSGPSGPTGPAGSSGPSTPPLPPSREGGLKERDCTCTRHPCRHEKAAPPPRVLSWAPDTPAGKAWRERLDALSDAYAVAQLEKLRPAELAEAGCLVVTGDDRYFVDWCKEHYGGLLEQHQVLIVGPSGGTSPPQLKLVGGGTS